jgi:antitoxin ParD1/3/4
MTTLTISLPDSLKTFIDDQIATKGYGNVSEYIRGLLRDAQAKEQDARLEMLLLEGLASQRIPLDAAFREGLAVKLDKIIDAYKDRARP